MVIYDKHYQKNKNFWCKIGIHYWGMLRKSREGRYHVVCRTCTLIRFYNV